MQVDGLEFENSSMQVDARFIPDDISFEGRKLRDQATSLPSRYGKHQRQRVIECALGEGGRAWGMVVEGLVGT